jgi:RHS repeat-associated protein
LACALVGTLLAAVPVVATSAVATGSATGVVVKVGYVDSARPSGFFPSNPWYGDPGVSFHGCVPSTCTYDGGAILVTNTSPSTVTINSVKVFFGTCTFDLWPHSEALPAGQSIIDVQTVPGVSNGCASDGTFDTSDVGPNGSPWAGHCDQSGVQPVVEVTVNGTSTAYVDSNQILNTGGVDFADCPTVGGNNESQPWTQLNDQVPAGFFNGGGSHSAPQVKTCQSGQPVVCTTGDFWESYDLLSIPGRGVPLDLNLTYNSLAAAQSSLFGFGWSSSYDPHLVVDTANGVATVIEENGSTVVFTINGSSFDAPSYVPVTLMQNADGTFTYSRLAGGDVWTFSAAGALTKQVDRNGYTTSLAYDNTNKLTSVTDPAGRALTFTYGINNKPSQVTDSAGRNVSFSYDTTGDLASFTDAKSNLTQFGYDTAHQLLTVRYPTGGVLTNSYDSHGRVTSQTDPNNHTTTFAYNIGTTTITDPRGVITKEHFSNGIPVAITHAYGTAAETTTKLTYDPVTLGITSVTDPNGHTSSSTFDTKGNVTSSTDALGRSSSATYNTLNEPTSSTDASGLVTSMSYDTNGNLLSVSRPVGSSSQSLLLSHGDSTHPGDVTATTDSLGHVSTYSYDTAGNLTAATDALGDKTTFSYDAAGRRIGMVSPRGNAAGANAASFTTSYSFDPLGHLLSTIDPLGNHMTRVFDGDGNLASETDAANKTTSYSYDAADRLITVTRPGASTLGTGYDANGNVTSQTDPLGHVTSYGYDVFNRVTSMTDPLGRTTSYAYDAAGRLVSKQDPGGSCAAPVSGCTTYTHDAAGQLTGVTYSDGVTPNATFAYNTRGQVTSETDGGVFTRAYSYDTLGRVTGTTDTRGSGASASSESVGYGYDLANQLTNLDVTSYAGVHRSITRTYDNAGRMKTVADGLGHTTTFSYDRDSDLTLTAFGNNTNAVYSYDNAGQLINTIIATATGQLTFPSPRNNLSLVTQDNPTGTPAGPGLQYGYDPLQRLTSVSSSSTGATSYNYDNADRITGWATTTANRTFNYDNASQLTSQVIHPAVGATDTISYSYDTRGNRLTKTDPAMGATSSSYSYDQANRLTTLTLTGGTPNATTTQHYSYDSTGLRTDLNWDLAEGLPLVVNDETGNTYVTGPDGLPVEQISPTGTAVFYGHDQLGSTRALTASNGTIAATYTYDPYGNTTTSPGAPTNPIQYAGQYTDPTTGLIYMRARWYDPTTASFLTRDPLADRTGVPYAYVGSNPVNWVDQTGLSQGSPPSSEEVLRGLQARSLRGSVGESVCIHAPDGTVLGRGVVGVSGVTLYRYVAGEELEFIVENGFIPNTDAAGGLKQIFLSPDEYTTIADAEKNLLIGSLNPMGTSLSPIARITVELSENELAYAGNVAEGLESLEASVDDAIPLGELLVLFLVAE